METDNGEIYYEVYVKNQWRKDGDYWKNEDRLKLDSTKAVIEMNPAENTKNYPIGMFYGDMIDPG